MEGAQFMTPPETPRTLQNFRFKGGPPIGAPLHREMPFSHKQTANVILSTGLNWRARSSCGNCDSLIFYAFSSLKYFIK